METLPHCCACLYHDTAEEMFVQQPLVSLTGKICTNTADSFYQRFLYAVHLVECFACLDV